MSELERNLMEMMTKRGINWEGGVDPVSIIEHVLTLSQQRCDLLETLLGKCNDLLSLVPMSYPYNDRARELRTDIYKALKLGIYAAD